MADPVGVTLGAIGLVHPLFVACREIINGYKLTQTYGADFNQAKRKLQVQCAWFKSLEARNVRSIDSTANYDPFDENNLTTDAVLRQLRLQKARFAEVKAILDKTETVALPACPPNITPPETPPRENGRPRVYTIDDSDALTVQSSRPQKVTEHILQDSPPPAPREDDIALHSNAAKSSFTQRMKSIKSRFDIRRKPVPSQPTQAPELQTVIPPKAEKFGSRRTSEQSSSAGRLDYEDSRYSFEEDQALAKIYQQKSTIFQRCRWALSDQQKILAKVQEIEQGNMTLEFLLPLKARDQETIFETATASDHFPELEHIQGALERLHVALAASNGRASSKKDTLEISIKIDENIMERTAQLVSQEEALHGVQAKKCLIGILHGHGVYKDKSLAVEFLTRTDLFGANDFHIVPPSEYENSQRIKSLKSTLSRPLRVEDSDDDEFDEDNVYMSTGFVSRCKQLPITDAHMIYRNEGETWKNTHTLQTLLTSKLLAQKYSVSQRLQLARIVTRGHLHLANIRHECRDPRPADIRFYQCEDEYDSDSDDEDSNKLALADSAAVPDICGPYFNIGFGSKPARVRVGAASGASARRSSAILELGLLLYQIGTCEPLNYGNSIDDVRKARREAMLKKSDLDRKLGMKFTELVEFCLRYGEKEAVNGVDEKEVKVLKGMWTNLKALEESANKAPDMSFLLH